MLKVMFFITGIGYGDSVREYAILQKLCEFERVKVLIAGYDRSYAFFKDKFPIIKIKGFETHSPTFKFGFYRFARENFLIPFSWKSDLGVVGKKAESFSPDVIVTDFEPLGVVLANSLRKKLVGVFGVEPKSFEEFYTGQKHSMFRFMQAVYLKSMYKQVTNKGLMVVSNFLRSWGKNLKFVNPIVRDYTKGKIDFGFKRKRRKPILVILGGSSFGVALGRELIEVLGTLRENFVVFGLPYTFKSKNVKCMPHKENIMSFIEQSSGIISLAGYTTISEVLALEKPLLSFPIPNHLEQQYNAYLLEKHRLALVKRGGITKDYLKESVKEFLKRRVELEKRVNKVNIRCDGAQKAAKIILNYSRS